MNPSIPCYAILYHAICHTESHRSEFGQGRRSMSQGGVVLETGGDPPSVPLSLQGDQSSPFSFFSFFFSFFCFLSSFQPLSSFLLLIEPGAQFQIKRAFILSVFSVAGKSSLSCHYSCTFWQKLTLAFFSCLKGRPSVYSIAQISPKKRTQ